MYVTSEIRLAIVLIGELLLPGWAWLAISGLWRRWERLQRWIVAVGVSIAFYPVLFYGLRFIAPWFTLGPYKMSAGLLLCLGVIIWRMRRDWREQIAFEPLEWVALAIVGTTLLTRYWVLRDHPYPAWTDSLHHTILTQLTAVNGQLPLTMAPYVPVSLDQYHLGLYALTAPVQWLARVPAHTALLWIAQFLNGICGVGVYLLLDRYAGRRGALVGAVVAGLLMRHPAFYFNWGRFTQVAAQAVLLIAWTVVLDALEWAMDDEKLPFQRLALAAFLSGSVFLLHFRVAAFYGVLVIVGVLRLGGQAWRRNRLKVYVGALGSLGALTLLVISPALWKALARYSANITAAVATIPEAQLQAAREVYNALLWESVPYLLASRWLMGVAGACVFVVIIRRSRTLDQVFWAALLPLLGLAYQLGIPWLNITNLSGILIMYYLPLAVVIGDTLGWLFDHPRLSRVLRSSGIMLLGFLFCLNGAYARATAVEPYRYFLTNEDVHAMMWIRENVSEDAVFAINTQFWLPRAPHGADGGYWIPYFAERQTTAGVMINNLGSSTYLEMVIRRSHLVKQLESGDITALQELRKEGVSHIYLGARPHFAGGGLSRSALLEMESLTLVYDQGGVAIFALAPLSP